MEHSAWTLVQRGEARIFQVVEGRPQGKTIVARLAGVEDRDEALALVGAEIQIERAELPKCEAGQYYWVDLEGLDVVGPDGRSLGRVDHLIATGANDVLVLEGNADRLIPFVYGTVVTGVDLQAGKITVTWDSSYWDD